MKESLKKLCDEGDWIRQSDKSHYWSFEQGPECMISGFRRGVKRSSLCSHVTQRRLVVSYRRFGTTNQSCITLQKSEDLMVLNLFRRITNLFTSWAIKKASQQMFTMELTDLEMSTKLGNVITSLVYSCQVSFIWRNTIRMVLENVKTIPRMWRIACRLWNICEFNSFKEHQLLHIGIPPIVTNINRVFFQNMNLGLCVSYHSQKKRRLFSYKLADWFLYGRIWVLNIKQEHHYLISDFWHLYCKV